MRHKADFKVMQVGRLRSSVAYTMGANIFYILPLTMRLGDLRPLLIGKKLSALLALNSTDLAPCNDQHGA